jgi:hypothetical protein
MVEDQTHEKPDGSTDISAVAWIAAMTAASAIAAGLLAYVIAS